MDRNELRELMERDLVGKAFPEEAGLLRTRKHISAWYEELVTKKRFVDLQFMNKKAKLTELHGQFRSPGWSPETSVRYKQAEVRFEEWKSQIRPIQIGLEVRINEAREIKKNYLKSSKALEKSPELVELLKRAAKLISRVGEGAVWHDDFERGCW